MAIFYTLADNNRITSLKPHCFHALPRVYKSTGGSNYTGCWTIIYKSMHELTHVGYSSEPLMSGPISGTGDNSPRLALP